MSATVSTIDLSQLILTLQQSNTILASDLNSIIAVLKSGIAVLPQAFARYQAQPANPTGTTSLVGVMMGLGGVITPVVSGRVLVVVSGTLLNASAIADGAKTQIYYGTGGAPANGAALTGTAVGGIPQYVASTTLGKVPFSVNAIVASLTLGTTYWIDLSLAAITGGTAAQTDVSISAMEF